MAETPLQHFLATAVYVPLPGGASVLFLRNVAARVTVRYDVGTVTYGGVVSMDAANVVFVNVHPL